MMSDPFFLRTLLTMNCELITVKQQQLVKIQMSRSSKLKHIKFISKAGLGLYQFVLAVLDYCKVFREVIVYILSILFLLSIH